jgi:hypothetical protein
MFLTMKVVSHSKGRTWIEMLKMKIWKKIFWSARGEATEGLR